ncbi:MAG: PhoPQ-activated protein PqaA family protein [Candidatus Competibacterales bacterium]|nr:PhoPQ-activated protein PqaA family protein [Candidatus Competibacterales bacterium]
MRHRFLSCCLLFVLTPFAPVQAQSDALRDYVERFDPNYDYRIVSVDDDFLSTTYVIEMTSQQWRDASEVDRPIWQHEVVINVPRFRENDTALLIIAGSSNPPSLDTELSNEIQLGLNAFGMIGVLVKQIPNQPLVFADDDGRQRKEDEILAYSMDKYLETEDPEWPVHVAMTKAAVRAMDTAQDLLAREEGITVPDFIVLGGSKRGWTSWLTAAVDDRIRGAVPDSIDMLNLDRQFRHHWGAYGFFAPAVQDYAEFDMACRLLGREGQKLLDIVDPYAYRNIYAGLPKLILNSAGDQFFLPDSSRFYYDELPAPKALRYSVNTDHRQDDDSVITSALTWVDDVRDGKSSDAAERFTWRFEPDGSIRVETLRQPEAVRLWQATNPAARDFRLETLGAVWTSTPLADQGGGVYIARVETPDPGWTAFLVELIYDPPGVLEDELGLQLHLTTGVRVLPDTLPHADSFCEDWLRLFNISTRGPVGTGENTLRAGFIVDGEPGTAKRFLVKAEGPILNLPEILADPELRVLTHPDGSLVAANDDWQDSPEIELIAEYAPPADPREAALVVDLSPGQYIAEMSGKNGTTGLGLVAVTEIDQARRQPALINVSTRGPVSADEDTLRAGFIVDGGAGTRRVLVKGEGPILDLPGVLENPQLRLYNLFTGEILASNDDWREHPTSTEVAELAPPASDREAAFVIELAPGAYIAELSGVDGGTGLGLVAVTETAAFR